jgi:hypothetical protein
LGTVVVELPPTGAVDRKTSPLGEGVAAEDVAGPEADRTPASVATATSSLGKRPRRGMIPLNIVFPLVRSNG